MNESKKIMKNNTAVDIGKRKCVVCIMDDAGTILEETSYDNTTEKATSIDHVNMKVKNLEQNVEFYKNLFGFEIKQEENANKLDAPSKIIGNDAIKLCLYEVPEMSPEGGIAHFGFNVANFNEVIAKCTAIVAC